MIGYPLDSHVTYTDDGIPVYDRAISSTPMRKLIKKLFSDGVMPNPSTNMQVSAGDGMNVIVQPGFAICSGCMKLEESQRTLAVQASDVTYDRIDTVVLRLNDNDSERICDFYVLQGTPAASPVRPELTRDESIWELGIADLFIAKSSTLVSNQRITDTRYETERCGVISSISEFDTTTLYQQVQADLVGFQKTEQAKFLAWFETIKDQLTEDAAANLQDQIDKKNNLYTTDGDHRIGFKYEYDTDGRVTPIIDSTEMGELAYVNDVTTVSKALVEIGLEGYTTVNASVHMVKLSKNIANITINYKIVSNTKASDKYVFIDMEKIKSALGITSLEFSPTGTMVVFQPIIDYSDGTMIELTSYADESYRGYTGLLLHNGGGLARVHNDSGTISPWPLNTSVYTPSTLGTIIINGAAIE